MRGISFCNLGSQTNWVYDVKLVIKYNIEITTGSEMIKNETYSTERIKNDT